MADGLKLVQQTQLMEGPCWMRPENQFRIHEEDHAGVRTLEKAEK
jgi:hypothetical protein